MTTKPISRGRVRVKFLNPELQKVWDSLSWIEKHKVLDTALTEYFTNSGRTIAEEKLGHPLTGIKPAKIACPPSVKRERPREKAAKMQTSTTDSKKDNGKNGFETQLLSTISGFNYKAIAPANNN